MTKVSELTPEEGVELALTILLEKGFNDNHYNSWRQFVCDNYGYDEEDLQYPLAEWSGVWQAMLEGVSKNKTFINNQGISACWVADETDGDWQDRESYFVVLRLIDDSGTRYFMREGYYHSYDGGHLEEGEDKEVSPRQQVVTVWSNK